MIFEENVVLRGYSNNKYEFSINIFLYDSHFLIRIDQLVCEVFCFIISPPFICLIRYNL